MTFTLGPSHEQAFYFKSIKGGADRLYGKYKYRHMELIEFRGQTDRMDGRNFQVGL